jgi:hypothetical protein
MLPEYFALVSTLIASMGAIQYLYLTARGKVQPNKVTYFFWGLFPLIAFFAQSHEEVSSVIWITLAMGILPFLTVIASYLNEKAYWKIEKRDYVLAAMAVTSMVAWYLTDNAVLAIVFTLVADMFASLPTIIKSYTHPHSEDWRPYAINAFGFLIGVCAVQNWVFAEYSFVLYFFSITTIFAILIFIRQRQVLK